MVNSVWTIGQPCVWLSNLVRTLASVFFVGFIPNLYTSYIWTISKSSSKTIIFRHELLRVMLHLGVEQCDYGVISTLAREELKIPKRDMQSVQNRFRSIHTQARYGQHLISRVRKPWFLETNFIILEHIKKCVHVFPTTLAKQSSFVQVLYQ